MVRSSAGLPRRMLLLAGLSTTLALGCATVAVGEDQAQQIAGAGVGAGDVAPLSLAAPGAPVTAAADTGGVTAAGTPEIQPGFDTNNRDYVARCAADGANSVSITITAPSTTMVSIDRRRATAGGQTATVPLTPGQRFY